MVNAHVSPNLLYHDVVKLDFASVMGGRFAILHDEWMAIWHVSNMRKLLVLIPCVLCDDPAKSPHPIFASDTKYAR